MTCYVVKYLKFDRHFNGYFKKQTVMPKVNCLYVFDPRVLLIFHFSQLSGIFLTQKQYNCLLNVQKFLQRIFCCTKTNQVKKICHVL